VEKGAASKDSEIGDLRKEIEDYTTVCSKMLDEACSMLHGMCSASRGAVSMEGGVIRS